MTRDSSFDEHDVEVAAAVKYVYAVPNVKCECHICRRLRAPGCSGMAKEFGKLQPTGQVMALCTDCSRLFRRPGLSQHDLAIEYYKQKVHTE